MALALLLVTASCTSKNPTNGDPGTVALLYWRNLEAGDLTKAESFVYADDIASFRAVIAAVQPGPGFENLTVGRVAIDGATAYVTLVGTRCRPGVTAPATDGCVTVSDPNDTSDRVRLTKRGASWYVRLAANS